jgi:hypothetical protein
MCSDQQTRGTRAYVCFLPEGPDNGCVPKFLEAIPKDRSPWMHGEVFTASKTHLSKFDERWNIRSKSRWFHFVFLGFLDSKMLQWKGKEVTIREEEEVLF